MATGDLSEDTGVAQTFDDFFKHSVNSLNISENKLLLTETEAAEAIKMKSTQVSSGFSRGKYKLYKVGSNMFKVKES